MSIDRLPLKTQSTLAFGDCRAFLEGAWWKAQKIKLLENTHSPTLRAHARELGEPPWRKPPPHVIFNPETQWLGLSVCEAEPIYI